MYNHIRLSEMIEKHMRKNNMTMKELAEKVGKSESSVSLWISGKTQPRMGVIQQLADIFNITADQLIFGDDQPNTDQMLKTLIETSNKAKEALLLLNKLNDQGQSKIIENIKDLSEIEKYKKQDN